MIMTDVFYVPNDINEGTYPVVIDIIKSWDGTFYCETNVMSMCGRKLLVRDPKHNAPAIDGIIANCGNGWEAIGCKPFKK